MLLTVEYKKEEVEIYADVQGLDLLIERLLLLKKRGGHEHLMTPSWGGNELTEQKQSPANELIHHLCIMIQPVF